MAVNDRFSQCIVVDIQSVGINLTTVTEHDQFLGTVVAEFHIGECCDRVRQITDRQNTAFPDHIVFEDGISDLQLLFPDQDHTALIAGVKQQRTLKADIIRIDLSVSRVDQTAAGVIVVGSAGGDIDRIISAVRNIGIGSGRHIERAVRIGC